MANKIPLGKPSLGYAETQALGDVASQQWLINGPRVRVFEEEFSELTNTEHAAAVSSCTAGMHLVYSALGFDKGSEIILPAYNFIADGLAVLQAGMVPKFVDVNPNSGNIDPVKIEQAITKKTRAILMLHFAGNPAPVNAVKRIATKYNLVLIEDASHALGSYYQETIVGNLGDIAIFSFGPLKTITSAGMGGMVVAKNRSLIRKVESLRSYGMSKSSWDRKNDKTPWKFEIGELGHNFRMTDFQAAVGSVQLQRLPAFIKARNEIAHQYVQSLRNIEQITFLNTEENTKPCLTYFCIITSFRLPLSRDGLVQHLNHHGIGASVHWDPPINKHALFLCDSKFENAEWLAKNIVSLPLYPEMAYEDVKQVTKEIKRYCSP